MITSVTGKLAVPGGQRWWYTPPSPSHRLATPGAEWRCVFYNTGNTRPPKPVVRCSRRRKQRTVEHFRRVSSDTLRDRGGRVPAVRRHMDFKLQRRTYRVGSFCPVFLSYVIVRLLCLPACGLRLRDGCLAGSVSCAALTRLHPARGRNRRTTGSRSAA